MYSKQPSINASYLESSPFFYPMKSFHENEKKIILLKLLLFTETPSNNSDDPLQLPLRFSSSPLFLSHPAISIFDSSSDQNHLSETSSNRFPFRLVSSPFFPSSIRSRIAYFSSLFHFLCLDVLCFHEFNCFRSLI